MKAVEHLQTLSVDYVAGDPIPCEGNWRLKEVAEVMALFKANPVSFTYKESAQKGAQNLLVHTISYFLTLQIERQLSGFEFGHL